MILTGVARNAEALYPDRLTEVHERFRVTLAESLSVNKGTVRLGLVAGSLGVVGGHFSNGVMDNKHPVEQVVLRESLVYHLLSRRVKQGLNLCCLSC